MFLLLEIIFKKSNFHTLSETGKDDAKKGDKMERLQKGEEVDIDLGDPEVQAAATKIQASFRGHKAREDVKKQKDEEAAAIKIQASFRGHKAREMVNDIKVSQSKESVTGVEADTVGNDSDTLPEEARKVAAEMAEESEKQVAADADQVPDVNLDDAEVAEAEVAPKEPEVVELPAEAESEVPDRQKAEEETSDAKDKGVAGDVQAEEARGEEAAGDSMEAVGESTEAAGEKIEGAEEAGDGVDNAQPDGAEGGEVEGEADEIDLDLDDPDLHNAALKIQSSFRGHKVREGVKAMKSPESSPQGDDIVASEERADDEKQDVKEGDEDVEPSVTEGADGEPSAEDSKPSED